MSVPSFLFITARRIFLTVILVFTSLASATPLLDDDCGGELVYMPWLRPQMRARVENRVVLEGEGFALVPVTRADGPFLEELGHMPDVINNFGDRRQPGWPPISAESVKRVEFETSSTRGGYRAAWIIKKNGQPAGYVELTRFFSSAEPAIASEVRRYKRENHIDRDLFELMVAYVVHPRFRSQGLATQSLRVVREFAEHRLGADLLIASVYPDNANSLAVIGQNGFSQIPTQRHTLLDWFSSKDLR